MGVRGGTLLGCRSTSYVGWFPGTLTHSLWWVCGVGGLLFVNYIVDASIFDAACIWSHRDHGLRFFGTVGCGGVVGVCGVFFDDCFVLCGVEVVTGTRWMPWHQELMKDVEICDKPRGADKRAVIRGFPNGVTRLRVMRGHSYLNS